jgi:hypothetical protein
MMTLFATLAAATLAQATPAALIHSVPITHSGGQATAIYEARPVLATRQVGMSAGTRMSSVRCVWTADVAIERRLVAAGGGATGVRTLAPVKTVGGSLPGDCAVNRKAIDRDLAARAPELKAHLLAVAGQDQRDLLAEVETLVQPSGGR